MKKVMVIAIAVLFVTTLIESIAIIRLVKNKKEINPLPDVTESYISSFEQSLINYEKEVKIVDLIHERYMMMNNITKEELQGILTYFDFEKANVSLPKIKNYNNVEDFEKDYFEALDEVRKIRSTQKNDLSERLRAKRYYMGKFPEDDLSYAININISDYDNDREKYIKAFFEIIGEKNGRYFDDEYFENNYSDWYYKGL